VAEIPAQFVEALQDRYRVERELGRGGMATVYLARDLKHDRPVALKVLRPEVAATLGPERFQREIRFAARLQHPHILSVHDSGEAAGQLWFTMPYVEGESLRTRLTLEGQLSIEAALHITCQVAQALQHAHEHGVGGASPSNKGRHDRRLLPTPTRADLLAGGRAEKALDQLEPLLKIPYYLSPGWLRIDPTFASLKGNPRFERLVAGK
jgi:serine/threonine-protein kinase